MSHVIDLVITEHIGSSNWRGQAILGLSRYKDAVSQICTRIGIPIITIRRSEDRLMSDRLIFVMEIPYPKDLLYIETGPECLAVFAEPAVRYTSFPKNGKSRTLPNPGVTNHAFDPGPSPTISVRSVTQSKVRTTSFSLLINLYVSCPGAYLRLAHG